jgi:hypothetical protein
MIADTNTKPCKLSLAQHFFFKRKKRMKPQQQDTNAKKESAVFVQTPEGEIINVKTDHSLPESRTEEEADQTADNTPTQSSSEVTSGEDA